MTTFSSLLLNRFVVAPEQLEAAIERQQWLGGHLTSNLMALGAADEDQLRCLLAEFHELPAGPRGRLPDLDANREKLVSRDMARIHRIFPLGRSRRTAHVASSGPLEPDTEKRLRDELGLQVRTLIVLPARIAEALWRNCGVPLTTRERALLLTMSGLPQDAELDRAGDEVAPPSAPYRRMSEHPDGIVPSQRQPRVVGGVVNDGETIPPTAEDYLRVAPTRPPVGPMLAPLHPMSAPDHESASELALDSLPAGPNSVPAEPISVPVLESLPAGPLSAPPLYGDDLDAGEEEVDVAEVEFLPDADEPFPPTPSGKYAISDVPPSCDDPGRATNPWDDANSDVGLGRRKRDTDPWTDSPDSDPPDSQEDLSASGAPKLEDDGEAEDEAEDEDDDELFDPPTVVFRHRGPFTREDAEVALELAPDVATVLQVLMRYARQYFERCMLLAINGERAEGRMVHRLHSELESIRVSVSGPSVLREAMHKGEPVITRLGHEGVDALLRTQLDIGDQVIAVMPMFLRHRTVALLYGDDEHDPVYPPAVTEVSRFAQLAGEQLARVAVSKKRGE